MKKEIHTDRLFGFPLFDRVDPDKCPTIIACLDAWQERCHGVEAEVAILYRKALEAGAKPDPGPAIVIDAPLAAEEAEIETLKETSQPPSHQEKIR